MTHKPYGPYEKYLKRPQDFLCALLATIVLSPIMLITAILVAVKLDELVENEIEIIERLRTLRMSRDLGRLPRGEI